MSRNLVPVMLGLTVFTVAAMAIAAYLVVSAGPAMAAVAGAIVLLALSVLATAAVALVKLSAHDRMLHAQRDHLRKVSGRSEEALSRIASLEEREAQIDPRLDLAMTEMDALRRDMHHLRRSQNQPPIWPMQAPPAADAPRQTAAGMPPPAEALTLELEPVIDLAAGSTSHYRAHLSLSGGVDSGVPHDQLIYKAEQGGMRPALDVRLVRLVAPVLRRLRARNPGLRVFVPIGRATLGAREEASRLIDLLQHDGDVAGSMVFEFTQSDLGRLEGPGVETLARMARSGAHLALSEVSANGLDLGALRQLGVRFLTFPPDALEGGAFATASWKEFMRHAQALHINIVAGSIRTPQQANAANRFARFGFGPFFAPPRKVRADAGVEPAPARNAKVA